jgi:hypothetical protein
MHSTMGPAAVSSSASWLHYLPAADLVPAALKPLPCSHSSIPAPGQLPFQGYCLETHSSPAIRRRTYCARFLPPLSLPLSQTCTWNDRRPLHACVLERWMLDLQCSAHLGLSTLLDELVYLCCRLFSCCYPSAACRHQGTNRYHGCALIVLRLATQASDWLVSL